MSIRKKQPVSYIEYRLICGEIMAFKKFADFINEQKLPGKTEQPLGKKGKLPTRKGDHRTLRKKTAWKLCPDPVGPATRLSEIS